MQCKWLQRAGARARERKARTNHRRELSWGVGGEGEWWEGLKWLGGQGGSERASAGGRGKSGRVRVASFDGVGGRFVVSVARGASHGVVQ